jgi:hypothetical protein
MNWANYLRNSTPATTHASVYQFGPLDLWRRTDERGGITWALLLQIGSGYSAQISFKRHGAAEPRQEEKK